MDSKRGKTLSSSRRSRKSYDSESGSESFSDDSRDSSRRRSSGKRRERSRSRSQGRTNRRHRTSDDSSDSGRDRKRKNSSSRKISEEEIAEYLAKKAQRKVFILFPWFLGFFLVLIFKSCLFIINILFYLGYESSKEIEGAVRVWLF